MEHHHIGFHNVLNVLLEHTTITHSDVFSAEQLHARGNSTLVQSYRDFRIQNHLGFKKHQEHHFFLPGLNPVIIQKNVMIAN